MKRHLALLLLLLTTFALLAPARELHAGQQNPLSFVVRAGYDGNGQYRNGHWFPVQVVVANDGADISADIEWFFSGDREPTFRYGIDLPRGARKQVRIPVVTIDSETLAEVHLVVDGKRLLSQRLRLSPVETYEAAVGILSSDTTLLNSLSTVELMSGYTTELIRLDADLFPTDVMTLAGLDVLVLHDLVLTDAQRDAVQNWVYLGGTLLVSGGPDAMRTTAGLGDLLPVEVGSALRQDVAVQSLERLASRSGLAQIVPRITANVVTPQPGAHNLDGENLILLHDLGAGRVIFAAFDLTMLRAWQAEASLWQPLLIAADRMQIAHSFRLQEDNPIREALQLDVLHFPSPFVLLLLILVYIVVIGPVNFIVLRRLKRVDLAWVTTPVLVAIFLVASYATSFILRGTSPIVSQLAFVQSYEGIPGGQATAFVGIFSPHRHSYDIDADPEAFISPGTLENYSFNTFPVTRSDNPPQLRDLLVDVSSLRTLIIEQPLADVPTVQSQITLERDHVTGSIENTSGDTLYNALLVVGNTEQDLGDLRPGADVSINLFRQQQTFPHYKGTQTSDIFAQDEVLMSLFRYHRFAFGGPDYSGQQGIPEDDGVYLLAWRATPALELAVDGDRSIQQGMTLFIIRLKTPL